MEYKTMKKLFWMTRSQRFSIRKYSIGVASVLIGMFLLGTPKGASADELTNTNDVTTTEVVGSVTNDSSSTTTSITTEAVSTAQETPTVNQEVAQATKGTGSSLNSSAVSEDSHVNAEATRTDLSTNTSNGVAEGHTTKEITPAAPSVDQSSKEVKTENIEDKVSEVVEAPTTPADNQSTDKATTKVDDEGSLDDDLATVEDFLNQNQNSKLSDGANTRSGRAIGDDYPASWRNNPNSVDSWGYYTGNCTSFVANRLHNVNHFEVPRAMGNGAQWGAVARSLGYRVDNTPAVGSVAYYTDGGYGHVAWVAEIVGGNIVVEEYNWIRNGGMDYTYHTQTQPTSKPAGFIHFKDLSGTPSTPTSTTPSAGTSTGGSLPSSGTYRFTNRKGIKSEPRISSADIAYYDNGSSVNYDKTVIADNYEWISYVSYSGARRYIAINQVATRPTTPVTTPSTSGQATSSLPSSGIYRFTSRKGIKSEPKISSADIAYYDNRSSVNYDKTLVADNYEWISYVSYSGARRYIAINQVATQPTTSGTSTAPVAPSRAEPTGTISITNKNDQTGTFDVIISNVSSPNGVKEVKVPTWSSENGQDDIIWYVAAKQGDGTYKVSVNPSDHKNSLGEYNVHLYYVQNDGKMVGVGGTTTIVKAVVRPSIPDKGRYTFSGHASIKAEPKMSSPELAYYDAGDGVNYDKVLLSDGHYWISYVSFSGNRRYISVAVA